MCEPAHCLGRAVKAAKQCFLRVKIAGEDFIGSPEPGVLDFRERDAS